MSFLWEESAKGPPGVYRSASAVDNLRRIKHTINCLYVTQFFTSLDTQCYNPILPLMLRLELGVSFNIVGIVFASLTLSSMVSFILLPKLALRFSPKQILLGDFAVRFLSGGIETATSM